MKKLITTLLVGILAFVTTGCSSGTSSGVSGQTLIVGATELSGTFSPIYYSSSYDGYVVDLVYQSLLDYDADSNLVPTLAEELPTVSDDGKTITFKLKEGIKFSDGSDFNAYDVKFTFTVTADPSYTGRYSSTVKNIVGADEYMDKDNTDVTEISGIEIEDDYTITFHLKEARVDSVSDLGTTLGIISDEQFADYTRGDTSAIEDAVGDPIGTGPYVLNTFDKASSASLVRNSYFEAEEGQYQIQNIIIKKVESSTEIDELTSGSVDLLAGMVEPKKIGPASLDEDLTFNTYARAGLGYIGFNTSTGATADKAVRQALAYAFDRQSFVDSYYEFDEGSDEVKEYTVGYVPTAYQNPASSLGSIITGEEELEGLTTYEYDIEKAKELLDEAGWVVGEDGIREKDGEKLTIKLMAIKDHDILNTLIPMWQKSWGQELGIDLQQTTVDFNTLLSKTKDDSSLDEWNVYFMATSFTGTTTTEVNNSYDPDSSENNRPRLDDEELVSILEAAIATNDEEESLALYKQALILANEDMAYLPVYGNQYFDLYNKKIKNLNTGPVCSWANALADAYIEE